MGEKVADGSGVGAQLIPGLLDELVLSHVMPRLPWYSRPVCRAISKLWKSRVDTKNPDLEIKTRSIQIPLLRNHFLICTFDTQVFITDNEIRGQWRSDAYQIQPRWRRLPPVQGLIEPVPTWRVMIASSGMVYVWTDERDQNFVLKMDIGCGNWSWNMFPAAHDCFSVRTEAMCFNGKIYVPGIYMRTILGNSPFPGILVYDMMTDQCGWNIWNHDNLTVVSPSQSSYVEEMYGFVEHKADSELELKMYDVGSDCWKTWEKLPIPESRWSRLTDCKVLNGNCFEPVAGAGTNVVCIDREGEVITWFNSSLGKYWVEFDYCAVCDGKYLEYMQIIRGALYGIFMQEPDEQEDNEKEKDEGGLWKRFIMKGKIMAESDRVAWDEVYEVGFFEKDYRVGTSVVSPINSYTLMA